MSAVGLAWCCEIFSICSTTHHDVFNIVFRCNEIKLLISVHFIKVNLDLIIQRWKEMATWRIFVKFWIRLTLFPTWNLITEIIINKNQSLFYFNRILNKRGFEIQTNELHSTLFFDFISSKLNLTDYLNWETDGYSCDAWACHV